MSCFDSLGGSWKCECNSGFSGDGTFCTDIDECFEDLHDCDVERSNCSNTHGSYTCDCFPGYEPTNGPSCGDINECQPSLNDCPINSTCQNTAGTYNCFCESGTILQSGRNIKM